jgi:flagellar motor switch protein FliG
VALALAAGSPARDLTGPQKAAVLVLALGEERAARVLRHLTESEVESVSLEVAHARNVPHDVCMAVAEEAVESVVTMGAIAEGGVDYARSILESTFGPDRAAEIIARLSATIERRAFEFLRRTPAEQIAVLLRNESQQTIALVIANLHTTLAANVLTLLDPADQPEVARRIAVMGEIQPEVVARIEAVIRQKLSTVSAPENAVAGGVQPLADILSHADRSTERNVLDQLAESDAPLAEEVRLLLFTFEDIVKLDDRSVQLVLKEVDQQDLAIALRGVNEDVRVRVFANMSARGAEMLREEIEFQPPQRRRVVEEAQGRIVAAVRRLEEDGSVVLARSGNGGEDELL